MGISLNDKPEEPGQPEAPEEVPIVLALFCVAFTLALWILISWLGGGSR